MAMSLKEPDSRQSAQDREFDHPTTQGGLPLTDFAADMSRGGTQKLQKSERVCRFWFERGFYPHYEHGCERLVANCSDPVWLYE